MPACMVFHAYNVAFEKLECFQEKHAPAKAGVDTGFPSGNTTKQQLRVRF